MRSAIAVIGTIILSPVLADEVGRARLDCAAAAIKQFNVDIADLRARIRDYPLPQGSFEPVLLRRRIEEKYCARLTQCAKVSPQLRGQTFSQCLDMEADERLRHLTR